MKAAGATVGAVALAGRMPAWAGMSVGLVQVWSSFRDKRHAQGEGLKWKAAGSIAADAIVLDPGTVKQEVLGFGGAMTDATCYVLSQLSEAERGPIMHDLFSPE
jgi:glucosylceramidase